MTTTMMMLLLMLMLLRVGEGVQGATRP